MEVARYRFGLFELDAPKGELRREGAVLRLQRQPAQVLACLLRSAGQVVTREELSKAVWGEETFVDFERGLNFCIAQVREALDDDATTPRFVRTIPKRGYQFIAPVERLEQAAEPGANAGSAPNAGTAATRDARKMGNEPRRAASQILRAACAIVVVVILAFGVGYRRRSSGKGAGAARPAVVAVVRFDNETGDAAMARFADGLTDTVVEQLTSESRERYFVIGNAAILRRPREGRDLNEIAASLGAGYVVVGQVQASGAETRILAHLIRMPEQTHLWVVRVDRAIGEPLRAESDLAQKIAADFSEKIAKDASGAPLPPFPNR